jgi:hypothetical protein
MASILGQSGIRKFEFLSPKDAQALNSDAAWRATSVAGTLSILTEVGTQKPEDFSSTIIARDAKACKDQFLSGSMPNDKDSGGVHIFTACRGGNKPVQAYYTILTRETGGYYLFSTINMQAEAHGLGSADQNGNGGNKVESVDSDIRNAAYHVLKK